MSQACPGLDPGVSLYQPVLCPECASQLARNVVMSQLAKKKDFSFCSECGEKLSLPCPEPLTRLSHRDEVMLDAQRIATPCSVEDLSSTSITRRLTSYSMPVLTGAFTTSPIPFFAYAKFMETSLLQPRPALISGRTQTRERYSSRPASLLGKLHSLR